MVSYIYIYVEPRKWFNSAIFIDFDKAVSLLEAKLSARIGGDSHGNNIKAIRFAVNGLASTPQSKEIINIYTKPTSSTPSDQHSTSTQGGKASFGKQQAPNFRFFNHLNNQDNNVSTTALYDIYHREIEEQLADTLYKRAQAKLIVDPNTSNFASALEDALKVISPEC
jgi:hypothetical protein